MRDPKQTDHLLRIAKDSDDNVDEFISPLKVGHENPIWGYVARVGWLAMKSEISGQILITSLDFSPDTARYTSVSTRKYSAILVGGFSLILAS